MHWKIHPPRPSRFPSGGDFAPLGPRDCPRASPSGNLSGLGVQNPRPWEISWASGSGFSNTSLLSAVYGYNIHCHIVHSHIVTLKEENKYCHIGDLCHHCSFVFILESLWADFLHYILFILLFLIIPATVAIYYISLKEGGWSGGESVTDHSWR